MSATPPTVLNRSFSNFICDFVVIRRYARAFNRTLQLLLLLFFFFFFFFFCGVGGGGFFFHICSFILFLLQYLGK